MNHRFLKSLQLSLAIMDLLAINAVFFISQFIFRDHGLITNRIEYSYFGFFISIAWVISVLAVNIYNEKYVMTFEKFTKVSCRAYIYFLLLVILYLFFFRMLAISRIFVSVTLVCVPVALLMNRFIYLAIYLYVKKKDWLTSKVLVIGYNSLSKKLASHLQEASINKEIVGFCEEDDNVNELSFYPILSNINNAMEVCREHGVTEIYSTIAPEQNNSLYQLIQSAEQNCIRFRIVPDLGFFINKQMHIDYIREIPVISLRHEPLEDLDNRIKKRIFDIVISFFVVTLVLSWLIPVVALLIWLESKGPIFFVQSRTGKDNKTFQCLKFRSMYVNEKAHTHQASRNDSRITRIGRFMRRTNIDEFPQFINVLKGDMSIVGPRPHMLKHTDEYSKLVRQYMVRQFLKPGITGWAQVNGLRGETRGLENMQQRVEHDIYYMENWSLFFDLKIVFMTAFNTIAGDENAF
ncbi:MAG: undecaprenyl-phosphate glucose phosphotransferase [Chitinophagaceae bacterium]|nr:undecaprenyl-phosphate glucose phosphotransferase [Chitinophagaceae bacterium]